MTYNRHRIYVGSDRAPIVRPWTTDGILFRDGDGNYAVDKGLSQFRLLDRYANGDDLSWVSRTFPRYTRLRVWPYVPVPPWNPGWNPPPVDVAVSFVKDMNAAGWLVSYTLLTDNDPRRVPYAIALVEALAAAGVVVWLEGSNEPNEEDVTVIDRLRPVMRASGFLWGSGFGGDVDKLRVDERIIFHHSARTSDWPRRTHDAMEFHNGDGPEYPHIPLRKPVLLDEPIRPDDAPGDLRQKVKDYRAYGGGAGEFCGSATFHFPAGKNSTAPGEGGLWPLTDEDLACADALADGLEAFAPDAPLGNYRRIVEPGQSNEARTYVMGERCMVRSQQATPNCPESGWTPIDGDGILWRK